MKYFLTFLATAIIALSYTGVRADENEVIAKVMNEGMKGKTSLMANTLAGTASDEEIKALNELVGTLKGTKAIKGDQAAFEKKVASLIEAMGKVAGGDKSEDAIKGLKTASDCKACHTDHKP